MTSSYITVPRGSKTEALSRRYSEFVARIRVPFGILLGLVYIIFARPTGQRLIWGSAIAFAGLLLRAWGAGHLHKNRSLATGGPYSYTRHPLYWGSTLAGIGYCLAGGCWWFFVLLGGFLSAVYWPVIRREESHLGELFPEEYRTYRESVSALFSWPTRRLTTSPAHFSWKLYWTNREYQASLAFIAIVFVLLVKLSI